MPGCPSYDTRSWKKLSLSQKLLAQISQSFYQDEIAEKTKMVLSINIDIIQVVCIS